MRVCDECGKPVKESEIALEVEVKGYNVCVCRECLKALYDEKIEQIEEAHDGMR